MAAADHGCYLFRMAKLTEVHLPVFDLALNLTTAIDNQLRQLESDGFRLVDRFYEFSWMANEQTGYEARFKKLVQTPDGTPALVNLVKPDGDQTIFAFLILIFGPMQDMVKSHLIGLTVGEEIAFRFQVPSK